VVAFLLTRNFQDIILALPDDEIAPHRSRAAIKRLDREREK
jgi:hypothetical protein